MIENTVLLRERRLTSNIHHQRQEQHASHTDSSRLVLTHCRNKSEQGCHKQDRCVCEKEKCEKRTGLPFEIWEKVEDEAEYCWAYKFEGKDWNERRYCINTGMVHRVASQLFLDDCISQLLRLMKERLTTIGRCAYWEVTSTRVWIELKRIWKQWAKIRAYEKVSRGLTPKKITPCLPKKPWVLLGVL